MSTPSQGRTIETASEKMASSPLSSQQAPAPNQLQTRDRESPLLQLIAQSFAPFDHQTAIVAPFAAETNRDIAFEKELSAMLLDVILETHAWAANRPKNETNVAMLKFEERISDIMEKEKEQGMSRLTNFVSVLCSIAETTRQRLNEFVTRMKTALAALM